MKLKQLLVLLVVLIFVSKVGAIDSVVDDAGSVNGAELSSTSDVNSAESSDTVNTMSWPAIPGESLNNIARAFYPKNRAMRRLFVLRTLRLNANIEPKLKASAIFEEPILLTIPTLKSLSKNRQAISTVNRAKLNQQDLSMSYSMHKMPSQLPVLLLQEYELLQSKNAFLKAELERLQLRLGVLQQHLNNLKPALDQSISLPASATVTQRLPETKQAIKGTLPAEKVIKNLKQATVPANQSVFESLKYWLLALLTLASLVILGVSLLRQYRQRMLNRLTNAVPDMDNTMTDFGQDWQDTDPVTEPEYVVKNQPNSASKGFLNTDKRDEQAKAISTLDEAKLLMSISRTQDAIAHLKLTIETEPKAAINHHLFLLEIFKKLNLKQEFEHYAKKLHLTFNVMMPVWDERNAAIGELKMVVAQYLEEFPHIIDKLDAVWPSALARVYLQSLITDNRDGERAGFSGPVLEEILMLIAILDTRKALEKK